MSRTVRLVYMPGYPLEPEALMPRHRLAYAAGALSAAGHEVSIHDFATVSGWEAVYPDGEREHCRDLLARFAVDGYGQPLSVIKQLWQLRKASKAFRASRNAWATESIRAMTQRYDADALVFELCNVDDVELLTMLIPIIRQTRPGCLIAAIGPAVDQQPDFVARALPGIDAVFPHSAESAITVWTDMLDERGHWIGKINNACVFVGDRWQRGPRNPSPIGTTPAAYSPGIYPAIAGDEKIKLFTVEDYRGCHCQCNTCPSPHIGRSEAFG